MKALWCAALACLALPIAPPAQNNAKQSAAPDAQPTSSAAALPTPVQDPSGKYILPCETAIHIVLTQDFNGKKASVGDKVPLVLAEDLSAGNMLFAQKGSVVNAIVRELVPSRVGGAPGFVRFELQSFLAGNTTVFIHGDPSREGQLKSPGASVMIPVVGAFVAFRHGTDANVKKGTLFTAFLSQDTLLDPLK
ncbi:MAG TPA: hypothetical protein VFP96_06445 [Candidatus Acidoferrum sp.]|nr:hypothetical protein [Candidatus Acidoferrum sp.]